MKVPGLTLACCLLMAGGAFAAEETKKAASVPELIEQLANDDFKVREAATLELWKKADAALPALQEAAHSDDPEKSFRASDLVRKIEYAVTPDTDPNVIPLLERYSRSTATDKSTIYRQLAQLRAWEQMLKLYAKETPPQRLQLKNSVKNVAITAARERLLAGDAKRARDFLEMGSADQEGLISLAAFHRSQGSLAAEIKRANAAKSGKAAWLMALHREDGNLSAARQAAETAGDSRTSAMLAIYEGDPLPWLRQNGNGNNDSSGPARYTDLAIRRWEGKTYRSSELEPLIKLSDSRDTKEEGIAALFLLGEKVLAEQRFDHSATMEPFVYFDKLEQPGDALKTKGFDPEQPDFKGWAAKLIPKLAKNDDDEVDHTKDPTDDLITVAAFLEHRGCPELLDEAYISPLLELSGKDPSSFLEFVGILLTSGDSPSGVPMFLTRLAKAWAGNDPQRWHDLLLTMVGEDQVTKEWFDWMQELNPVATDEEKMEGLMALFYNSPDASGAREKWINLAWAAVEKAPENAKQILITRIYDACQRRSDVRNFSKAWSLMTPEQRKEIIGRQSGQEWNQLIVNFSAMGRWDEAASFFVNLLEKNQGQQFRIRPEYYAYAAASLRRAGNAKQAQEYDDWADKLALGDPSTSYQISLAYTYGQDDERAAKWLRRSALESLPDSNEFLISLEAFSTKMMESGNWAPAAATLEVKAHVLTCRKHAGVDPAMALRTRQQADLAHGLALLKTDRTQAIRTLEACHSLMPGDGTLADYFFPALRKAGLIKEHDAWFEKTWSTLAVVIARYPQSDNLLNTTGWLAGRAARHLDEAEGMMNKALTINPYQPAFLDTMAEIQFAKGNARKAVEWSDKSLNYLPEDPNIRRQNARFKAGLTQK